MQELNYKYKFLQPLSYVGLRFIVIILIIISQLLTLILCYSAFFNMGLDQEELISFIQRITTLSTSLVCVTTFSIIYRKKSKPFRSLLFYFILSCVFYFLEIFVFFTVAEEITAELLSEAVGQEAANVVTPFLIYYVFSSAGNLNIFIDLFFCLILYLSIIYTPKNLKKINNITLKKGLLITYRCLAILPIAYVVISMILHKYGDHNIFITCLLATNKVQSYFFFTLVCIGFKIYTRVCKVEMPSSIHLSFIMIGSLVIVSLVEAVLHYIPGASEFGLGTANFILIGIPFVLIYDYQKVTKHEWMIVGVYALQGALYFFLFLGYVGLYLEMVEMIKELINNFKEATEDPEETMEMAYGINYLINNISIIT